MHKHWVALLSIAGLAGSTVPVESQVLKGSDVKTESESSGKSKGKTNASGKAAKKKGSGKLGVKQQTVRQQNQPAGNTELTKGAKGGNPALTK